MQVGKLCCGDFGVLYAWKLIESSWYWLGGKLCNKFSLIFMEFKILACCENKFETYRDELVPFSSDWAELFSNMEVEGNLGCYLNVKLLTCFIMFICSTMVQLSLIHWFWCCMWYVLGNKHVNCVCDFELCLTLCFPSLFQHLYEM